MFNIIPYTPCFAYEWDNFVSIARNATFLHKRLYMDYHAAHFCDASLMVYRNKKLCALFPANIDGTSVYSHRGLTYGGLLLAHHVHASDVGEILSSICEFYRTKNCNTLVVKMLPYIYNSYCADDLLYWLHRAGGSIIERNLSSCIDLSNPVSFSTLRRRHANHAQRLELRIDWGEIASSKCRSFDSQFSSHATSRWHEFWEVLTSRLHERYNSKPVHSIQEILLLKSRFPARIQLATVVNEADAIIAGTVLYVCDHAIHVQYIASTEEGRSTGALDLLFRELIFHYYSLFSSGTLPYPTAPCPPRYFDFGTSMLPDGTDYNDGLLFQKEGYGARAIVYDVYQIEL